MAAYKVKAVFTGDAKGLKGALDSSKTGYDKVEQAQGRVTKGAKGMSGALKAASVGAVAAIGAVGAAAIGAVTHFAKFEKAWAEVTTLFDGTPAQLASVRSAIDRMATGFGVDQTAAAKAYYQIVSSGAEAGTEANEILETAVRAATAGVTDLETAADGITTVLNAYGLEGKEASRISDILFNTVKEGKTTFEELSANIGKLAPIAASSNISIEELTAGVSELTKKGVSTSESMTQMKALVQSLIKPVGDASKISEKLGENWNAAALESNGLAKQLQLLQEETGGNKEQITKLLGSIEAYQAFVVLADKDTANFTAAIESNKNSIGATDAAFEKMSDTLDFQGKRVKTTFGTLVTAIGETVSENLDLVGAMRSSAEMLGQLGPAVTAVAGFLAGGFKAALDAVIGAMSTMWGWIDTVAQKLGGWEAIFNTVGAVARSFLAASIQLWSKLAGVVTDIWGVLTGFFGWLLNQFLAGIDALGGWYEAFVEAFTGWIEAVGSKWSAFTGWISGIFSTITGWLSKIGGFFVDAFTGWIEWTVRKISDFAGWADGLLSKVGVNLGLKEGFDTFVNNIGEGFDTVKDWAGDAFSTAKTTILDLMGGAADGATGFFSGMKDKITGYFTDIGLSREEALALTDQMLQDYEDVETTTAQIDENIKAVATDTAIAGASVDNVVESVVEVEETTKNWVQRMWEGGDAAGGLAKSFSEIAGTLQSALDSWVSLTGTGGAVADAFRKFTQMQKDVTNIVTAISDLPNTIGSVIGGLGSAFRGIKGLFSGGAGGLGGGFAGLANLAPQIGAVAAGIATLVEVGKNLFGGDNRDRVTVGVSASGTHDALEIDRRRAESGLQLFAHSRRAGEEGDQVARDMLALFLELDRNLTGAFKELGIAVDFSSTELRTGRDRTGLRPSATHDPFGSVAYDSVDQGDLEGAALNFVRKWVTELLPQLGGELQKTLVDVMREATSPQDILDGIQDVIRAREDAEQQLVREAVQPLVDERSDIAQQIAEQGALRLAEEARLEALRNVQSQLRSAQGVLDDFSAGIGNVERDTRTAVQRFSDLADETQRLSDAPLGASGNLETLTNAIAATGEAAAALILDFQNLQESIGSQFDETSRNISEAFLSEKELTELRKKELESLVSQLEATTDPALIESLTNDINALIRQIFAAEAKFLEEEFGTPDLVQVEGESDESFQGRLQAAMEAATATLAVEQGKLQEQYLAYVERVRETAATKIAEGIQAVIDKQTETADYVNERISTAGDDLATAIETSTTNLATINTTIGNLVAQYDALNERIAAAGGEFVEAAEIIGDAASTINDAANTMSESSNDDGGGSGDGEVNA